MKSRVCYVLAFCLFSCPGLGDEIPNALEDPLAGTLVLVPQSKFVIGSKNADDVDERPAHEVEISRAFYVASHEVTFSQFRAFVSATGYKTQAEDPTVLGQGFDEKLRDMQRPRNSPYTWRTTGFEQTDNSPVVNVSWNDAVAFCRWLTDKSEKAFRLPTEAEWEYACRAGTTGQFSLESVSNFGMGRRLNVADRSLKMVVSDICPAAKYGEKWKDLFPFTAPVGSFPPNRFGIYDMHGNVAEWCEDFYIEDRYLKPEGFRALTGEKRVIRGGSFWEPLEIARSAKRGALAPATPLASVGFRVVMDVP